MRVLLVAPNANPEMGGEAIKAVEYFRHLIEARRDVVLLTHARNRVYLRTQFPEDRVRYVADGLVQRLIVRSPLRWFLMDPYFHWSARRLIRGCPAQGLVVHYLCPISPVQPRFPPRGYRYVIGPLNGNLDYPPAFRHRKPPSARARALLYAGFQWAMGRLFPDKKRAHRVLIAGGARSRQAVVWAGVRTGQILDVLDAGVPDLLASEARLRHAGTNCRMMSAGRLDGYKAFDMAIAAVAKAGPEYSLAIYGDGPMRADLEGIAARLGVADRVTFHGWAPHDLLIRAMRGYRAMVFPTLAEANGIIMQEAMMVGLPVIALNWGGPAILGRDGAAVLVEPSDEAAVVEAMAAAVRRVAVDSDYADGIAVQARRRAEMSFLWRDVAASWSVAYADLPLPAPHPA